MKEIQIAGTWRDDNRFKKQIIKKEDADMILKKLCQQFCQEKFEKEVRANS